MDAGAVFRFWQRVLRDETLESAVFAPDIRDRAAQFNLTPEEVEIAVAFAHHRKHARWPINGFRIRAKRDVISAVEAYCPITAALLVAHGHELSEVARDYLDSVGWRDHGPYAHRLCAAFLAYVQKRKEFATILGLADAIALEIALQTLNRRLADLPPNAWQAPATPPSLDAEIQYQRTPAGIAVTLEHVLTALIMEPEQAGNIPLEPGPQHILIYLTSVEEPAGYAVLSDTAKRVFDALEQPLSLSQAMELLEGAFDIAPDEADSKARAALTRFLNLDVIRPVGDSTGDRHDSTGEPSAAPGAASWDDIAGARGTGASACFDQLLQTLVQGCGELAGARVLDVGMGNGNSTLALARAGAREAVGIDISERAVAGATAHIRAVAGELAGRIGFQTMDAARLDFADASFDVVTCLKTIWCLPSVLDALREFHRVLRPGGRLVVQLWGADERCTMLTSGGAVLQRFVPRALSDTAKHNLDLSPDTLGQLFVKAGLSAPLAPATFARTFEVRSPAHYWELFRTLGDGGYYTYITRTAAEQAAMNEHWMMQTSSLRGPSGTVLDLEWHICAAKKDE